MENRPGTTIELPPDLASRLQQHISHKNFDSINEYIIFVIEEVLYQADQTENADDEHDDQAVADRLKALGYLNE